MQVIATLGALAEETNPRDQSAAAVGASGDAATADAAARSFLAEVGRAMRDASPASGSSSAADDDATASPRLVVAPDETDASRWTREALAESGVERSTVRTASVAHEARGDTIRAVHADTPSDAIDATAVIADVDAIDSIGRVDGEDEDDADDVDVVVPTPTLVRPVDVQLAAWISPGQSAPDRAAGSFTGSAAPPPPPGSRAPATALTPALTNAIDPRAVPEAHARPSPDDVAPLSLRQMHRARGAEPERDPRRVESVHRATPEEPADAPRRVESPQSRSTPERVESPPSRSTPEQAALGAAPTTSASARGESAREVARRYEDPRPLAAAPGVPEAGAGSRPGGTRPSSTTGTIARGRTERLALDTSAPSARGDVDPVDRAPRARKPTPGLEQAHREGADVLLLGHPAGPAEATPTVGEGAKTARAASAEDVDGARRAERQDVVEMHVNRMTLRSAVHAEATLPDVGRVAIHAHGRGGRVDVEVTTGSTSFAGDFASRRAELENDLGRARVDVGRVWVSVEAPREADHATVHTSETRSPPDGASNGDTPRDQRLDQGGGRGFDGESSSGRRGRALEIAPRDRESTGVEPWRRRRVRIVL